MIIDGNLPKFDLPIDFIADDSICWRESFVEMTLSLFFLIHLSKYMKYLRIPVFALPDFLLSLSLQ